MSPICVMCEVQGVTLSAEFAVRLLSAEISRQCVSTALQKKPFATRCRHQSPVANSLPFSARQESRPPAYFAD